MTLEDRLAVLKRASPPVPVLDLRNEADFGRIRLLRSVNIEDSQLSQRFFELPPKGVAFVLVVKTGAPRELPTKGAHGWSIVDVFESSDALWDAARKLELTSAGELVQHSRLWKPCDVLEDHIDLFETPRTASGQVSGRLALDVGCGSGRDLVYLANRGWTCTGLDNLASALHRAAGLAKRFDCSDRVDLLQCDVRRSTTPFTKAFHSLFDLVLVVRFIHRPLMGALCELVRPGGVLVYAHFLEDLEEKGFEQTQCATEKRGRTEYVISKKKRLTVRSRKWPEEKKPLRRGELKAIIEAHGQWDILLCDENTLASPSLMDERPFVRMIAKKVAS